MFLSFFIFYGQLAQSWITREIIINNYFNRLLDLIDNDVSEVNMFHSVRMRRNEYRLDNEPSPSPSPQFRMIQVRVDPLENQPVPLPIDSNVAETATTEEEEDYQRFTCEICYEFLNEPVGCGSCSSRFCRSCLQRVYDSDMRKQQQGRPRCPV